MKSLKQMLGDERERKNLGRKLFAIAIVGALIGLIGVVLSTLAITIIPFIIGQVGGEEQKEVYGREDKKNIVERFKGLSGKKKIGVGIGLVVLLPFIAIALMWFMVVGTAYWMDILYIVPIVLIAGFLFFYKKERQTNVVGKVMGNPVMGIIGIVVIVFLVFMAVQGYMAENQYKNVPINTVAKPLTTDPSDYLTHNGTVVYATDSNGNYILDENGNPIPELKTVASLTFRCVDDFFYSINFQSVLHQNHTTTNGTVANDTKTSLTDTSGLLPIPYARVSMDMKKKDGTSLLALGQKTDANGLVSFNSVPYGTYVLSVDIGGYFKFSRTVHLNENFDNQVVNIHLMPVYYKVALTYKFTTDMQYSSSAWQLIDYTEKAHVFVEAHYMGGISVSDLQNLRRQQSWYSWSGLSTGGVSNQMLKTGMQMQSMMNDWTAALALLFPPLGLIGAANSHADTIVYQGHQVILKNAYVVDSGGNHPAYWRQFPSENSKNVNWPSVTNVSSNDTGTLSTLQERTYFFAMWTTSNAEGNTFKAEFNVSTFYSEQTLGLFDSSKTAKVSYKNLLVTWNTELPSMDTKYWSAK